MTRKEVYAYVAKIRNPLKREYAQKYLAYCESPDPNAKAPKVPNGLSYMGAQAVRLTINSYNPFGPQEPPDDPMIYNRKVNGKYRPLEGYFNR